MEGNKLITTPDKTMPNLVRIVYENGGHTPDLLLGLYTGWTTAQKAIQAYEALKPIHEAQEYAHQKNISNEEEARLFAEVEKKVAEDNKKLADKKTEEDTDGKESKSKSEDKS